MLGPFQIQVLLVACVLGHRVVHSLLLLHGSTSWLVYRGSQCCISPLYRQYVLASYATEMNNLLLDQVKGLLRCSLDSLMPLLLRHSRLQLGHDQLHTPSFIAVNAQDFMDLRLIQLAPG